MSEHSDALKRRMSEIGPCIVAFSGGVDSSVVAAAGYQVLGADCLAVTGISPAVSQFDRSYAINIAQQIGVRHRFIETREQDDPQYIRNDQRRCYHCKSELFRRLREVATEEGFATIVTGTNADDLGDYRPGLDAGRENLVQTPLADLGFDKSTVRSIAAKWHLDVADRPAAPCLASRIAYGVQADPSTLAMIEAAEAYLRKLGLREFRVRVHADQLARIEVSKFEMAGFLGQTQFTELVDRFKGFGFRYVTLDLQGFESGSLNRMLRGHSLPIWS